MLEKALISCTIDSVFKELKKNDRVDDAFIEQFHEEVNSQNLVIGIVGKMKAGKSSLVNAAVFNKEVLPAGSQPITVTLTEVAYAEHESVEVDLLTLKDVAELMTKAAYSGKDKDMAGKAKVAQSTLNSLPADYEKLIKDEKTLCVGLSELNDFVSSTGKYSGLAKFVRIRIPDKSLKGVTIVDTPGFNDPISSRGETTRNCLSRCNVILFVHNQDGYDQTDETLLREQIEYAGISEIIDVYNKVDLLHIPFSEWEEQKEYYIEKRDEYVESMAETSNIHGVITKADTILISSLMALCGLIKSEDRTDWIKESRAKYQENYEEFDDCSDDKSLDELFIQYSNINEVVKGIDNINRNSSNYLMEAPLLTLKGKIDSVIETVNGEISECKTKIANYDSDYNSAMREIEEVEAFMQSIGQRIMVYQLEDKLLNYTDKRMSDFCSERSKKSATEFTKENYPEPSLGAKNRKQNVAKYNTFVSYFENTIRDGLGHDGENGSYGLKGAYRNEINEYVNSITSLLVSSKISSERRDLFKQGLLKELRKNLANLNVLISSHSVKEPPKGKQLQWSLFKTKFENTFDDGYFDGLLSQFRQIASALGDPETSLQKIQELRDELVRMSKLTPAQKEKEKKAELETLEKLEDELRSYSNLSQQINKLIKSK